MIIVRNSLITLSTYNKSHFTSLKYNSGYKVKSAFYLFFFFLLLSHSPLKVKCVFLVVCVAILPYHGNSVEISM